MALDPKLLALVKGAKNKYSRNAGKALRIKEGKTTIRVLRHADPSLPFWHDLGVHWIKDESDKVQAVVGCRDICFGEDCEIDAAIEQATKGVVDDETLKVVKGWKARASTLLNVLVRSGSDASEEPQVLELTPTTFGQILSTAETYAADDIDIFDNKNGCDLVIERTGRGLDTEYNVVVAPKSKPVPAGTIEKMHDLRAFIEREYFRGDEPKALRAIGAVTGVSVGSTVHSRLAAPTSGVSTGRGGLLTGPSAAVDDAAIEEAVVEELETSPLPSDEDIAAKEAADKAERVKKALAIKAKKEADAAAAAEAAKKKAAEEAAKAAAAKKAAETSIVPAADAANGMTDEEIADLLGELDDVA